MTAPEIYLLSTGTALPGPPVETTTLARHLGLDAQQGRQLATILGIRTRHLCRDLDGGPPRATLADLATTAAGTALAAAGIGPAGIQAVVMSTATPDSLMPATVNLIADRLGVDQVPSYQIAAGATGALQAIDIAVQLLSTGRQHTVLVIAGDVSIKQLDLAADRGDEPTGAALDAASFGDGAAAAVLTSLQRPGSYALHQVTVRHGTAGTPPGHTADWLGAARRGARGPNVSYDRELIAKVAPRLASDMLTELLTGLGWQAAELALLLPPQLPCGVAASLGEHLTIPAGRCDNPIEVIGNAANALPLFQLASAQQRTGPGDRVAGVAVDPSSWCAAGFALQRL